jgi:hypothetical protein
MTTITTGSEKQIAWATTIKATTLRQMIETRGAYATRMTGAATEIAGLTARIAKTVGERDAWLARFPDGLNDFQRGMLAKWDADIARLEAALVKAESLATQQDAQASIATAILSAIDAEIAAYDALTDARYFIDHRNDDYRAAFQAAANVAIKAAA